MLRPLILALGVVQVFLPLTQALAAPAPTAVYTTSGPELTYTFLHYTDHTALIKSVKLLEKFGFNTATVAETLDLNTWSGGAITFWPASGGKRLNSEDVLGALRKNMQPVALAATDKLTVRSAPINQGGNSVMVEQTYQLMKDGQNINGSSMIDIPVNGLALTIIKIGNNQLLSVVSRAPQTRN